MSEEGGSWKSLSLLSNDDNGSSDHEREDTDGGGRLQVMHRAHSDPLPSLHLNGGKLERTQGHGGSSVLFQTANCAILDELNFWRDAQDNDQWSDLEEDNDEKSQPQEHPDDDEEEDAKEEDEASFGMDWSPQARHPDELSIARKQIEIASSNSYTDETCSSNDEMPLDENSPCQSREASNFTLHHIIEKVPSSPFMSTEDKALKKDPESRHGKQDCIAFSLSVLLLIALSLTWQTLCMVYSPSSLTQDSTASRQDSLDMNLSNQPIPCNNTTDSSDKESTSALPTILNEGSNTESFQTHVFTSVLPDIFHSESRRPRLQLTTEKTQDTSTLWNSSSPLLQRLRTPARTHQYWDKSIAQNKSTPKRNVKSAFVDPGNSPVPELDGTEPDSNSYSSLFLSSSRNSIANSSIGLATRLAFVTLSMKPQRESRAFSLADEWLGQCGHGDRMGGTYGRSFGVRPVTSCTRMVSIREQEKPNLPTVTEWSRMSKDVDASLQLVNQFWNREALESGSWNFDEEGEELRPKDNIVKTFRRMDAKKWSRVSLFMRHDKRVHNTLGTTTDSILQLMDE